MIKDFLVNNGLYLIPLQSVINGVCTCGKIECTSPGKHPLLRYSWKDVATADPERIEEWLQKKKNVNFGVPTGRKSAVGPGAGKFLTVVDIDARRHKIIKDLPETFSYRTGSGGHHFWFWSKYPFSNSVGRVAPKVDIRGSGGYVVIPPSRHISGKQYKLPISAGDGSWTPIADIPDFLMNLIYCKSAKLARQKKYSKVRNLNSISVRSSGISDNNSPAAAEEVAKWTQAAVVSIRKYLLAEEAVIPGGVRNVIIHRLLSSDRAGGASPAELRSLAMQYRTRCENSEEVSDKELAAMVSQVSKYKAYNTSFEKVNDAFFEFMSRSRKPEHRLSKEDLKALKAADALFFSGLVKLNGTMQVGGNLRSVPGMITLQTLSLARDEFMKQHPYGFRVWSKYPLPLLGTKLKSMGFSRKRTSSRNVWNVGIPEEYQVLTEGPTNNL